MKQPENEGAAPIPELDDSPLMEEVIDRGVDKIENGDSDTKNDKKKPSLPPDVEVTGKKKSGKLDIPEEPAFPDYEDGVVDDVPEFAPEYADTDDDVPFGSLPGEESESGTAPASGGGSPKQNLNDLFADSVFGGIKHFLPIILHSQTKIRETDIMILTKQDYLPEGSLGVVQKINEKNQSVIKKEVAQYEEEIITPLKAALSTWDITVSPEISLLIAFLGMAVGLFSLSMNIRKENKIAINEFMRQYKEEQTKKK